MKRAATKNIVEEIVQKNIVFILLTMNVSRRLPDGSFNDAEVLNKSQIYVNLISITIERSIGENPLNCWEALTY